MSNEPPLEGIYRYRQATPTLATSGQPREEQFAAIAGAGYEVVINLALHDDSRYSLQDEPGVVRRLRLGWSEDEAFALMREIWQPNAVWSAFVRSQLDAANAG